MDNKEERQKPENASDGVSGAEEAETMPPYKEVSGLLKKKASAPFAVIIMVLVFVGVTVTGFFLHKKLDRQDLKMLARLDQLEAKLDGLESDRKARKALRRELAVFQGDTAEAISKQATRLGNISGEVASLRQAMEQFGAEQNFDVAEALKDRSIANEEDDARDEEIVATPPPRRTNAVKRSKETQEYIDLVESTFEKFIRLASEGAVKLWDYFASLVGKLGKL